MAHGPPANMDHRQIRPRRGVCGYLGGWLAAFLCCAVAPLVIFSVFSATYSNVNMGMFIWMPATVFVLGFLSLCAFRRLSHGVLAPPLVALLLLALFTLQSAIFVGVDYHQKCIEYENLGGRATRMLYGPACPWGAVIYSGLAGVVGFVVIGFCIFCCGWSSGKSRERMLAYRALSGVPVGLSSFHTPFPKLSLRRKIINGVLIFVLVAVFVSVFYSLTFTTHPWLVVDSEGNTFGPDKPPKGVTTCPAGDIFYHQPHTADLPCCRWHNKATCVDVHKLYASNTPSDPTCVTNTGDNVFINGTLAPSCSVCDLKPDVWLFFDDPPGCDGDDDCTYQNSKCNKLSGLYTCSMFSGAAAEFLDYGTASQPINKLRMCSSFCDEWWTECQPFINSNDYSSPRDFCTAVGTNIEIVSNSTKCFSAASTLGSPSRLALAALAIIVALFSMLS
ncbi:uncharacterized protein AMSG_06572 [Thecamonas trahens ATCC 50062]|uniref:Uncharacterized protein n=1 Tax=Thecamonas trahens ATCC 50062 TaxID=461836 RepID=A0A0L0DGA5_THETB|nr:hypothetical protein AMSG_06572 [Thecamonas trahens ATCC 50062]KNC51215.1 hypothetical protein AMSG_06572 [Thecamonas trahens ATCC 50062]|eukprot:XP_013756412.1 hypothetical protein AMSG_06572 [Thecamonas trahens ATCC 50062]